MPLPEFNEQGDLPEGLHQADLQEIIARFGTETPQRQLVTTRLLKLYSLAQKTGKLERFIIFGSDITDKPSPNDVDIILVMSDDFSAEDHAPDHFPVFDHLRIQEEFGASLFAIRPAFILGETVDEFIRHWQIKRDLGKRGLVEIIQEQKS